MPTYELNLMIRAVLKPELGGIIKRTAETIFSKDGLIRSIENLGKRQMPYKTSAHGVPHREAHYYLITFDSTPDAIADITEEYSRDIDIIRRRVYKIETPKEVECTLHEEILPPAYRLDVKNLIDFGRKRINPFTYRFKYNSGMDYYPFNK